MLVHSHSKGLISAIVESVEGVGGLEGGVDLRRLLDPVDVARSDPDVLDRDLLDAPLVLYLSTDLASL